MHVRPLHDRILVQRLEEGEQRAGGVIIPDSAKEKPQRGTVIAAGNGKRNDDGERVSLDVKAGDTILFGKYAGQEIKLGGVEYVIMKEDEVKRADRAIREPRARGRDRSGQGGSLSVTERGVDYVAAADDRIADSRSAEARGGDMGGGMY
jgi:chaperonin GroES